MINQYKYLRQMKQINNFHFWWVKKTNHTHRYSGLNKFIYNFSKQLKWFALTVVYEDTNKLFCTAIFSLWLFFFWLVFLFVWLILLLLAFSASFLHTYFWCCFFISTFSVSNFCSFCLVFLLFFLFCFFGFNSFLAYFF